MVTASGDDVCRPRVSQTSATLPPPTPTASVRPGRRPGRVPPGRHVRPISYGGQYRNVTVCSPSTPPEYYFPLANTLRPPTNRVARAPAAALE
ncbi:hypothetical protein HPB50_029557 [Hyalomma asiaticum]|nr:hypothetical protein HPB50_029557 [Hyalomma asiaticum]